MANAVGNWLLYNALQDTVGYTVSRRREIWLADLIKRMTYTKESNGNLYELNRGYYGTFFCYLFLLLILGVIRIYPGRDSDPAV